MNKFEKKYYSNTESEGIMYNDVKLFLMVNNIKKNMLHNILLAVSEGFTNALVHGNNYDKNKMIKINIEVNNNNVNADIIDEGEGAIMAISSRVPSDYMKEGGRGIDLINHYADKVALKNDDKTGGLHLSMKFNKSRYSDQIWQKSNS
ncbi:MAG: ATP-binding protein [Candidatus Zixiibacteriota bacterium]